MEQSKTILQVGTGAEEFVKSQAGIKTEQDLLKLVEGNDQYKKILRRLSNGLQILGPAGNQPGDKFYLRLNYKRKQGKWKVAI